MEMQQISQRASCRGGRSQQNRSPFVANAAPVQPLAIECRGRKWAIVHFARPLYVAPDCGIHASDGTFYLIGVSHARLWFVADGRAVEPVTRGFTVAGAQMNIMPWETPAAALHRQTCC
jgi:hypothetical protein